MEETKGDPNVRVGPKRSSTSSFSLEMEHSFENIYQNAETGSVDSVADDYVGKSCVELTTSGEQRYSCLFSSYLFNDHFFQLNQ